MKAGQTLCLAVLALLASGVLENRVSHAQDIGPPQFFRINIKEVDEPANAAMIQLTEGMSLTLTALNNKNMTKVTIDPEYGKKALSDFSQAKETLAVVLLKIPLRKVNFDVIHKSPYAKAYDELVVSLHEANYPEPTDSKSFFDLLTKIIQASQADLNKLMNPQAGPAGYRPPWPLSSIS